MIDLRAELDILLNQDMEQDIVLLRHNTADRCGCVKQQPMVYDPKVKADVPSEAYRDVPNPYCSNCEGSGWVFMESITTCKYFYTPAMVAHNQDYYYGGTFSNIMSMYFPITERTMEIKANDIIFQLGTDRNGNLQNPLVRRRKWLITDMYEMHLDSNKFEFIKCYTKPMVA